MLKIDNISVCLKENNKEINHNELECDFVSTRIVELLNKDKFELTKKCHEALASLAGIKNNIYDSIYDNSTRIDY